MHSAQQEDPLAASKHFAPILEWSRARMQMIPSWNGQKWQIVPSPNGSAGNGMLNALAVVSANDIWGVGSFYDAKQVVHPL